MKDISKDFKVIKESDKRFEVYYNSKFLKAFRTEEGAIVYIDKTTIELKELFSI